MVEFKYDISKYSLKQLMLVPASLLFISLLLIALTISSTGLPVKPGIDFVGGTALTLYNTAESDQQLVTYYSDFPMQGPPQRGYNGWFLRFDPMSDDLIKALEARTKDKYSDYSIYHVAETFGRDLQKQALYALIISFIGMSFVVFIAFRTVIPSTAVIVSAFADIAMTAACMNIIGITLSLATTAALLMLIGYSVDSDILLTNRVLKRKGDLNEKIRGAFRTGIIMTSTTMAAVVAMGIIAYVSQIQVITEISSVLFIGLIADIVNTWLTNAGLLKWYAEGRGGR